MKARSRVSNIIIGLQMRAPACGAGASDRRCDRSWTEPSVGEARAPRGERIESTLPLSVSPATNDAFIAPSDAKTELVVASC